ncbi:hypothetical protein Pelo_4551 [Pelomyxa schiedti]|nr:hypothetical protein Pelo_4551 [Pelomyxa schiedti]
MTARKVGTVLVYGPSCVGKTALVESYVSGRWWPYPDEGSLEPSYSKMLVVDTVYVTLDLLDTMGQDEFVSVRQQYITRSNVVLLCFSLNDRGTFDEALNRCLSEIRKISHGVVILVGLKLDLIDNELPPPSGTTVSFQEGISAVIRNSMYGYFQCSSKQYIGLDLLFEEVCRAGMFGDTKPISTKKPGFFSFFSKRSQKQLEQPTKNPPHTTEISPATAIQTSLGLIPNDIWLLVMEYLDFVALVRVSRTCKLFYHLAKTEPMWTTAFRGVWNYPGCVKGLNVGVSDDIVCFGPNTSILLSNNKYCPMKDLAVGDQVLAFYPNNDGGDLAAAVVHCIWKCPVHHPIPMIVINGKLTAEAETETVLEITPDHPILLLNNTRHPSVVPQTPKDEHNHRWCLPTALSEPQMVDVECVYNLVLQALPRQQHPQPKIPAPATNSLRGHADTHTRGGVIVGACCCCTLGMNVPGYPDEWWGTNRVMQWLESRPDFPTVQSRPPPAPIEPDIF